MAIKALLIFIVVIVIVVAGYYLISPIFRVQEINEASPLDTVPVVIEQKLIKDNMDSMDAATKADFESQVEAMKDKIVVTEESMPSGPKVISQGEFKERAHHVEGKALLIESGGKKILRFEDFETLNGPNLHIYLSSELGNDDFIDLGKIKGTKGNFNYELDSSVDTNKYNKVLVWCVPFGVLFSYASI